MVIVFSSFCEPVVIDDPKAEAEQWEEYASSLAEPLTYASRQTLKEVAALASHALLALSCFPMKGKAKWAYDGVADALTQIKKLSKGAVGK